LLVNEDGTLIAGEGRYKVSIGVELGPPIGIQKGPL
jgi:hypothetical protein